MDLTHMNKDGRARMVDVSEKNDTARIAVAKGKIRMEKGTISVIESGKAKKGDVLAVAQVAGIMAAKKTWDLIPMCHPIPITGCDISFNINNEENSIEITATIKTIGKTGIEMEALTAVSAAALTIYDMVKAIDRSMVINEIRLMAKSGGKSGEFRRSE